MKHTEKIKEWDDKHCEQHVVNLVYGIKNLLSKNNLENISYIDIGANVGKVYELLKRHVIIDNVWMFEASELLFNYLSDKYKNDNRVKLYHNAVNDNTDYVDFDESSMIHQIDNNSESLNFGLSKIGRTSVSKKVKSVMMSDFFQENKEIYDSVSFIKIDTESVDFNIMEDILKVISNFKKLPIIEFEVNYFVSGMSKESAQKILDKFEEKGYNKLLLSDCYGDGILIPKNMFK